ncbi:MAG TPA: ATP-dependent helicase HrpB [Sandaracinaceae bacterium LLY-WYZ-13_1]|nr:ATP-dependent helicase HrpB [Sandaracinaceae bacterium LLY-WYZ-13_1]
MQPLPIDPHLPDVVKAVRERGGLVLVAEPGAGKTTRVPRALLDAGVADAGTVIVVEPRRLATRMAAARIADELGEPVGERIGYRVRFDRKASRDTRVELVTEGILARRLVSDPTLEGVAAVVFDELHERHLDTDLALARARRLREIARPDLAIVAMSATLEAEPVARFLDAPVLEVEGRAFEVEHRFAERPDDRPIARRVRAAVVRLLDEGIDGDVLVFLPGASEIRRCAEALEGPSRSLGFDVRPLHGDLPPAEQDRAVAPGPRRKVILSTNVAETSLTIDGVVAVVDSGLARAARHSPWTGLPSLDTVKVSQASAAQRAGRAGRTRPGVCVRLYTKGDHDARPPRDRPEIARADLTETVLALRAAGEDPRAFPYFEAPPPAALDAADALLARLDAVAGGRLTATGRALLRLPVHPRLGRVALEAKRRGLPEEGALLASLIGEREIRRASRTRFDRGGPVGTDEVASSDVLARLDELEALGPRPSTSTLRGSGLAPRAVRTVLAAARQLREALRRVAVDDAEQRLDEEDALLTAILAGFPDRVARRRTRGGTDLVLAGGGSATLDPASAVKDAELLVAVDATARRGSVIVRQASAVTVEQILALFLDRVEDVREARFDPSRGRVVGVAELRYDGLALEQSPMEPSDEEAGGVLAEAALCAGLERFCDGDALDRLKRRLAFARRFEPSLPDLDEAWLERLLVRLCDGRRSFAELEDARLLDWIRAELGAEVLSRLDALAPEHVAIPGRRRVPVNYEPNRPPWIQSRMQDFFGATDGPTVGGGREPLVLHLLAPNRRAVQVTTDLAGFWDRHWDEIRNELRRRYPKHAWPEDPRTAEPSRPGRRRR